MRSGRAQLGFAGGAPFFVSIPLMKGTSGRFAFAASASASALALAFAASIAFFASAASAATATSLAAATDAVDAAALGLHRGF